jgi:hypothetical protein
MPGRSLQQSEKIRKWIRTALKAGADSPRTVLEWIEQNADIDAPSIPTIGNVMKEEGYQPAGYKWEKAKDKKGKVNDG